MATASYKVLGQSNPAATTNTNLYSVPSATSTVISTITVCNQASTAATFRIMVRPAGATLTAAHYVAYDVAIAANDTIALTLGITLTYSSAADLLDVYASSANLSFHAYGSQLA
jgi:glucose-6-phosphate dehydrogenase assembly protein OpcA